jgi:large subunit ribosomal protein L19
MANFFQFQGENIAVGDAVRLHLRLFEAGKERIQIFDGTVLAIKGRQDQKMMLVRKKGVGGIGVERTIPLVNNPWLAKIDVKAAKQRPRRAKLYNLRTVTS